MASDKIKVALRLRPFSKRELDLGAACVVEMDKKRTVLHHLGEKDIRKPPKSFTYDHCFNSLDPRDPNFSSQDIVFDCLGNDILENAFKGYNACIFAYGQTGSGKSYTMMGSQGQTGIIPRLCDNLFERINEVSTPENQTKVEVSYMEIYNEKVYDLLDLTSTNKAGLKVREHNVLGPYVDGLSQLAVISYQEIEDLMIEGNKSRTVASTNMNNESSRSHAVFTVILTFTLMDALSGVTGEKVSRISLVDLAGSERAVKTGAVGERLKEGSNINKSLTTLGLVISKLSDQASGKAKDKFVPYRDSALTWLLKDNLGGNSKTVMVATVSPAADNYEETLSTLRYADRAKRIVNYAVVNEDPNARIIRELRAEVDALKEMLLNAAQPGALKEKLSENEKLMKEMSLTWEEKLHKTEQKQEDRRHALERMGISVQSSGIKVEKNKYFLVNLNDDPSLNELLVYYLKERTLVGRAETETQQDIQLMGLGIQSEHCIIDIEKIDLHITPLLGARTCVNGNEITERTKLLNGDRILWGSNHFFRVNCPKVSNCDPTPTTPFDWRMAQEEVMMAEVENAPMREAMAKLERQYEEDKQTALENQRKEYEKQFQQLKSFMSPSTPYAPFTPHDPFRMGKMTPSTPSVMSKLEKWGQQRDDSFKRGLAKLRGDIIRANGLAREANFLSEEMGKATSFSVTLQIPPHNLTPNRRSGTFISEPAILVKRKNKGRQVWSLEKLDLKLIDMRDVYEEVKSKHLSFKDVGNGLLDPFYETTENHNLIGVANIFLDVLFHDVRLDYQTPIISQQGEVSGRLHIEIEKCAGTFHQEKFNRESNFEVPDGSKYQIGQNSDDPESSSITCKLTIKAAAGLPPSLSHFVFCQYMFWGDSDLTVVPPEVNPDAPVGRLKVNDSVNFSFGHSREIVIPVNEEFIEHCCEGALSIEVYGHKSSVFYNAWEAEEQLAKARSLADRWGELTRKLELQVEIQELDESGEYSPVEVQQSNDSGAGGIIQMRQGQQRRLCTRVMPVANSGTLPIICDSIVSISVGSPCIRSKLQKPLDSYQEDDLAILRDRWSDALDRRREYLNSQIQKYINKINKTEIESEREQTLVDQWVRLTDERNAVIAPSEGSGVPGAPTPQDMEPAPGFELHSPVIFLDLNADDLSTGYSESESQIPMYGHNSILPKELAGKFFNLPIIGFVDKGVGAIASWDSSIHDSVYLNRITQTNERAYLIVKAVVRLSHPTAMDLVLRKRVCFNVIKRHSITEKIKRKLGHANTLQSVSLVYEIVSNVPKASEELEDRESLAVMAASGQDLETGDGETFIEKYSKGVSAVETILYLDRLRQNVAVKEKLTAQGKNNPQQSIRKTMSVPNFVQMSQSLSFDNISSLQMRSSLSFQDSIELSGRSRKTMTPDGMSKSFTLETVPECDVGDSDNLTRPTFLNLGNSLIPRQGTNQAGKSSPAAAGLKRLTRQGMSTLHEEIITSKESDEEMKEPDLNGIKDTQKECKKVVESDTTNEFRSISHKLPTSQTFESLNELQPKTGTPSLVSSGYGSQAASSTNLSSEDSLSIKSISVDETPDTENNLLYDLPKTMAQPQALSMDLSMLSPPDVSINSISPGEDTDHTVTETTPSSANITPSTSVDLADRVTPNECSTKETVVFRRKGSQRNIRNASQRSSCPTSLLSQGEGDSKYILRSCRRSVPEMNSQRDSVDRLNCLDEGFNHFVDKTTLPEWIKVGESIQIRPSNNSGVIAYIGSTEFASGLWVGVELDTSQGKNDGSVKGVCYFNCPPKRGVFVRSKNLKLDKRGREMRLRKRNKENDSFEQQRPCSGRNKMRNK